MLRPVRSDLLWRRLMGAALAVSLTVAMAACGDDDDDDAVEADAGSGGGADTTAAGGGGIYDDGGGGGGSTEDGAITIASFQFAERITADPGATLTVTNDDSEPHTVTADDGAFDVRVDPDGTGELAAPSDAGEYAFHCEIHPSMTSTLVVGG